MKQLLLFFLTICFHFLSAQQPRLLEKSDKDPFVFVEQMPEFPGGEDGYVNFLQKNTTYPTFAIERDIEGTVFINFIVNEDGTISNLKVRVVRNF
jgi:periplasmic protein TonB